MRRICCVSRESSGKQGRRPNVVRRVAYTIDTLLTELQGSCDAFEWESVDDSIARMRRAAELQYEAQRIEAVKLLMEPVLLDKLGEPGLVRRIVEAF